VAVDEAYSPLTSQYGPVTVVNVSSGEAHATMSASELSGFASPSLAEDEKTRARTASMSQGPGWSFTTETSL
jgi:hypothetical protein